MFSLTKHRKAAIAADDSGGRSEVQVAHQELRRRGQQFNPRMSGAGGTPTVTPESVPRPKDRLNRPSDWGQAVT